MSPRLARGEKLPPVLLPGITSAAVEAYLTASGDDNPLHRDPELARAAGLAGVPVPGMLVLAQLGEYLGHWPECRRIIALSGRFVSPVLVGRPIRLEARIVALDAAADVATLRLTAAQDERLALLGEARLLVGVARQPTQAAP
jgi:acyl dehydratase